MLLLLGACENTDEEINSLNKKASQTDKATKITGYLSQEGKVKAKLTAPEMLRVQADTLYTEFPKTLHVDFYNDSAKIETWLDAKYGKHIESYNKIYLRDSVRVISAKGDTLYCEDLWWDQNKELFYTDLPAIYASANGNRIRGQDGLEATQDLKTRTFKNNSGILMDNGAGSPAAAVLPDTTRKAGNIDTAQAR